MSDSVSSRASVRTSTFLNRPHIAPMGPRTRQTSLRASHILDNGFAITSPSPTGLDLPEFGDMDVPMSPIRMSAPSSPRSLEASIHSSHRSLTVLEEEPPSPEPETTPAYISDDYVSVEEPSQTPQAKVVAVVPPPRLVPPPAIKFETTPITWKGLPMEAALWTVDSDELQQLVSRAIRASARESFIRLLTVDNLDTILPAELTRLDDLKARTQSRYRFLVHRRTMLFHALNSANLAQQKDGDDGVSALHKLTSQLAETITECEQHLEEVININDQVAQIKKLIDLHWGSALAIALRKLNTSYARRTSELKEKKDRIKQLEAELQDAWKEAEKMAGELDDYEAAIEADTTEAVIETAEIVPVPKTTSPNRRSSIPMPMTPTLLAVTTSTSPRVSLSPTPISPSSPHFAFPPYIHLKAKETEAADVPDTVSIRSTRSAKSSRSRKSSWTVESTTHTNQVHAAKKRSQRASQSSLRLNTSNLRKQGRGHGKVQDDDKPPVPELPLQFAAFNGVASSASANASSVLLAFDPRINPSLRRQISFDSILTGGIRAPTTASVYQGRSADDLYVQSKNRNPPASEIEIVPRTPAPAQNFAVMYQSSTLPSRPPPKDPSKSIPSMWMNADAVKPQKPQLAPSTTSSPQISTTSSERIEVPEGPGIKRQNSTRSTTYSKLRGLTKRYSISLPMFNAKPSQTWLAKPRASG